MCETHKAEGGLVPWAEAQVSSLALLRTKKMNKMTRRVNRKLYSVVMSLKHVGDQRESVLTFLLKEAKGSSLSSYCDE